MTNVSYQVEPGLSTTEFVDVLRRSGLGVRRPINDAATIAAMLRGADLIVTARDSGKRDKLIGVSRCVTDFAFCCYCSDLAVDRAYQGQGIGTGLIEISRLVAGERTSFLLVSAPGAMSYYRSIKMPKLDNAFGWIVPVDGADDVQKRAIDAASPMTVAGKI